LVVDGPPEFLHEMARYPALPVLHDRLAEEAIVLLDDATDECNKEILSLWMKAYPRFEVEWIDTEKGTAILRRRRERGSDSQSNPCK
jgi:hypothetical protein